MMNLFWKGRFLVEIYFVVLTLSVSFVFGLSSIPFDVKPEELATLVGKAFSFKLPIEMTEHIGYTLKFKTPVSDELPSWLSFDEKQNVLLGVPSIHEKGSHIVRLDIIEDATNRTVDTVNYMTIEVVEFEEDINHFKLLRSNDIAEPDKNISKTNLDCPNHSHIIVATLVFDLSSRDLSGAQRTALLLDVSKWLDNDIDELRWMPGKGEKTAFNLKDAVLLTAGPGTEKDPKKRGVSVSWKIGCGDSITESEKSFASVNRLKSSSQNGAFAVELQSPVVAWHVTYGRVHHRHVVRVRRQVRAQTPVPTSTFIAPTSAIVTQITETPTMTKSPSRSSVASTSVRIIPTPTQTRSPVIPTAIPTFIPTSIKSTSRPSLNKPIDVLTAVVGEPFYFNIPADTFSDLQDGQLPNLRLSIYDPAGNPLPDDLWVKLLPETNDLVGTPTVPGTTKIALIVTDSDNQKSDLYDVIIQVLPRNNPPHLYNPIDVIPLYIGQPIAYKVPTDTFHDKEDGATENLSLTMTTREGELIDKFPWVEFNMKSQIIYALPMGEIIGKHEFLLIAHDRGGLRAFEAFEFHVYPLPIKPNHYFYLQLVADKKQYDDRVTKRVETLAKVGKYFHKKMNYPSTYSDIRLQKDENKENEETDLLIKWFFADIAKNILAVREYKSKYEGNDRQPYTEFKNFYDNECPIEGQCNVVKAWVEEVNDTFADDPDVLGRVDDDDDGIWWEYTIIPAFIVAALIFIIGLIIIICIRCRRISKVNKNEKIIFVKPKKPAIFREEYPMKEMYGEQPLVTPNDKPPLPPPAYPRSSTPTDDPSERLLGDNLHIYQAPFESSSEATGGSRPPNSSYRLPPPYVSP